MIAYTPLQLPASLPPELEVIIRHAIEDPYLFDIHRLLSFGDTDAHPTRQQLQISIAVLLLSVVSGVSSTIYAKYDGSPRKQFVGVLCDWYPWDLDAPEGVGSKGAAEILYDVFRNPLVHRLGLRRKRCRAIKIGRIHPGASRVTEMEQLTERPGSEPSLVVRHDTIVFWLDNFYWGVRRMIEGMAADSNQCSRAVQWLKDGKFDR